MLSSLVEALVTAGEFDRAEQTVRAITDRDWQADALRSLVGGLAPAGQQDRAMTVAGEVEQIARAITDRYLQADALRGLVEALAAAAAVPRRAGPPDPRAAARRGGTQDRRKLIGHRNREEIFSTIVTVDGPSQQDIAEITGLATATVGNVLRDLGEAGLVVVGSEVPAGRGRRGRRPKPLRVRSDGRYVAGVEVRSDPAADLRELHGVVTNLRGTVIATETLKLKDREADTVVDGITDLVGLLTAALHRERAADAGASIQGLGVQLGGHIDGRTGDVVFSPNLGWVTGTVPLRQRLRDSNRGLHTIVENDANAFAIAQQWFGGGRDVDTFAVVIVGGGIGGGIVHHGELLRGKSGSAGEIGHIRVRGRRAVTCQRCGNSGCLETVASTGAILKAIGGNIDLKEARRRAQHDPRVAGIFAEAGDTFGTTLAGLLNVLNPDRVILTGEVTHSNAAGDQLALVNDDYYQAATASLRRSTFSTAADCDIRVEDVGDWTGARGAATTVIRDIITNVLDVTPSPAEIVD